MDAAKLVLDAFLNFIGLIQWWHLPVAILLAFLIDTRVMPDGLTEDITKDKQKNRDANKARRAGTDGRRTD